MQIDLIEKDKSQRLLALKPDQSFIVQAPAGSGKTELLIQRFLSLLICVKSPEEILAITFTKKAANEMRARIINALKIATEKEAPTSPHALHTYTLAKQVLERDQHFNWDLINNPNQLRIQTIDSLCAYLTSQLPLLSHFGATPELTDHPLPLYRHAVQEVLLHIEEELDWSKAISALLMHLDNDLNKLHDLLIGLLAKRDQWLPYIQFESQDAQIRLELEQYLQWVIRDCLERITRLFPNELMSELLAIARFAASNLPQGHPSDLLLCTTLSDAPQSHFSDKPIWLALARLLLTKSFTWRKKVDEDIGFPALASLKNPHEKALHNEYRQRLNALIQALNEEETLRLALTELFFLPEPHYEESQWEILQALLRVLKVLTAQLRLTFQAYGQIDFIENVQAALYALGSAEAPTDLALALDYQIKHILVDEFQDTSFTQHLLLEKLTTGWEAGDGRTLFVVGDPMQSIYRFREAEVGLFIRMRQDGIGHIKLTPLTLSVNFRSHKAIVEWNNTHFRKIFPPHNDIAAGAVNYSPSIAHATTTDYPSTITIKGFVNATENQQATYIAELIKTLSKKQPDESIALLVRSRSHLATIIPALKKAEIAYRAIDIDVLTARPHIQDLLSLTRALHHPADRIAWLAILRAPWCGLTLSDLLVISDNPFHETIWEKLLKDNPHLSDDGRKRLSTIVPLLKTKLAERERYALRQWIESTWMLLGGPACLTNYNDMEDANAYFKLLEQFSDNANTLKLHELKEKVNKLFATAQQGPTPLQIMTIHTAKGLEFDTVIVPHLEKKMPSDDKKLLSWMEWPLSHDRIALLLSPIHAIGDKRNELYEFIERQQKTKTQYEVDRLLYVATTRAKKNLYLCFNAQKNDKEELRTESGSFLEKIWPHLVNQKDLLVENPCSPSISEAPAAINAKKITRLSDTWKNPLHATEKLALVIHRQQDGFQLKEINPKIIGIVSHRLLQQLSDLGIDWWTSKTQAEKHYYLDYQLRQAGMLPSAILSAITSCEQSIQHTLADERGQWILKPRQESQTEYAMTAHLDGQPQTLVIDKTFIDEKNQRWIIDFKTAILYHDDLSTFLDNEQTKYLEKMRLYANALSLMDARPIRLGLYFPALPAWKEWAY